LKDQVYSSQAYGLGGVLFADGTKWDRGYIAGNQIVGTTGNNNLTGTSGADTIDGRGGSDTVTGGGGADRYAFHEGYGALTINNGGTVGSAAHGELDFGGTIDKQELWFTHTGNDLVINHIGNSDQVTVSGWFGGDSSKQLSAVKLGGGLTVDSGLNSLISAMATFANDNPGFNPAAASTMPTDTTLQTAIAAAWH